MKWVFPVVILLAGMFWAGSMGFGMGYDLAAEEFRAELIEAQVNNSVRTALEAYCTESRCILLDTRNGQTHYAELQE